MVILGICIFALLIGIVFRLYMGKPTNVTVLEYQAGVQYRRGRRIREATPGRHRIWVGVEKIIVVDVRPISVSFENQAVTLADGSTAVYGFSGSAVVRDVHKTLYSAQNYSQMPAFVLLCCARLILNSHHSGQLRIVRETAEEEIVNLAKARLIAVGFDLLNFRLTHFSIATLTPQIGE